MKLSLRTWILLICIVLSVLALRPSFEKGVVVKSVDKDSIAFAQGLRTGDTIKKINNVEITSVEDYALLMSKAITPGKDARIDITTSKNQYTIFTNDTLPLVVQNAPHTRLKAGLDIQGGARALVEPDQKLTDQQLQDLIAVSNNRFNVFGLSDVKIRGVTDLSGNKFMLVEVAGATPADIQELISKQGKFESKIGNETVFVGGNNDITSVCRNDAHCAAITSCSPSQGQYVCSFSFTIYLSEEAAQRHADITKQLEVDPTTGGLYLKANMTLVLDDKPVESLLISKDLRGRVTTQISIQGSGTGPTQQDAFNDARASMNKLQTVLITGSLPYKLHIVKLDTISPTLGSHFVSTILLAGLGAMVAVGIIIFARYRKFGASIALLLTSFSELIIILGVAALIGWNLDLPSLAGILATIGTGVDQQIVILDEARSNRQASIKDKLKRAVFIIMSAYATSLVSLLPLYWAGAGLFKGFAITSIIGITAGVFITRPAFADILKRMES
jgi:preprotein translocase subunit SecD